MGQRHISELPRYTTWLALAGGLLVRKVKFEKISNFVPMVWPECDYFLYFLVLQYSIFCIFIITGIIATGINNSIAIIIVLIEISIPVPCFLITLACMLVCLFVLSHGPGYCSCPALSHLCSRSILRNTRGASSVRSALLLCGSPSSHSATESKPASEPAQCSLLSRDRPLFPLRQKGANKQQGRLAGLLFCRGNVGRWAGWLRE